MYKSSQLYDLSTNEMLKPMFPNLRTLVNVCMSLPVRTASVERSFSKTKKIKAWLGNRLSEKGFPTSHHKIDWWRFRNDDRNTEYKS